MIFTTDYDEAFTITDRIGTYYTEAGDYQIIEAHDEDGNLVSELYADLTTGQIMQVETVEEHRREGIATALATYATEQGITLYHSPAEHRTSDGNYWASQVGSIDEIDADLAYDA